MPIINVKDKHHVDVYLFPEHIIKLRDEDGNTRIYYNDGEEYLIDISVEEFIKNVLDLNIIKGGEYAAPVVHVFDSDEYELGGEQ